MAITDDILALEQKEKDYFAQTGKYVQCLQTPDTVPFAGSETIFTKLRKPDDEADEIEFIPTAKDYSFAVDVWSRKTQVGTTRGFIITAQRDLGNGIIETITRGEIL
jgi:hypothetical protein